MPFPRSLTGAIPGSTPPVRVPFQTLPSSRSDVGRVPVCEATVRDGSDWSVNAPLKVDVEVTRVGVRRNRSRRTDNAGPARSSVDRRGNRRRIGVVRDCVGGQRHAGKRTCRRDVRERHRQGVCTRRGALRNDDTVNLVLKRRDAVLNVAFLNAELVGASRAVDDTLGNRRLLVRSVTFGNLDRREQRGTRRLVVLPGNLDVRGATGRRRTTVHRGQDRSHRARRRRVTGDGATNHQVQRRTRTSGRGVVEGHDFFVLTLAEVPGHAIGLRGRRRYQRDDACRQRTAGGVNRSLQVSRAHVRERGSRVCCRSSNGNHASDHARGHRKVKRVLLQIHVLVSLVIRLDPSRRTAAPTNDERRHERSTTVALMAPAPDIRFPPFVLRNDGVSPQH